jgi:hypothetical protein
MLEEHDSRNNPKKTQKGCMHFYYCHRRFVSKMASNPRSRTIGKEEDIVAT